MKGFKTIDEQIALINSRGMKTNSATRTILLRENYYSIVNGYKAPFLDRRAMESNADDVFMDGAEFDWLYSLFLFDRELRQISFSYLIQAEAALKTATVYSFCQEHRGAADYLDRGSFVSSKDMLVPKAFKGDKRGIYSKNLNKLMDTLNRKLSPATYKRPFTAHYLDTYGEVPLWVLANDLTFGNMSHFYQLMKRGEQNGVCKCLHMTTLRGDTDRRITPHDLLRAYVVLVHFRNLCAHDERLYCAKVDSDTFATMVSLLEVALPKATVDQMRAEVGGLLEKYGDKFHVLTKDDLRKQLGI